MKRIGGLLILFSLIVIGLKSGQVTAAACANVSSFGSVTMSVPELQNTKDQVVWVRIQTPGRDAKILAEINGQECLQISGNEQSIGNWSWQTQNIGGVIQTVNFSNFSGNKIKLIGVSSGVKVDRVLITDEDCQPQDFGNSCQTGVEIIRSSSSDITELEPISNTPIGGKVVLSSTPKDNQDQLEKTEYFANGRVVQTSKRVEPFDTTLLPNGKHTVYISTYISDADPIKESIVVEVDNPENSFTGIIRWARLNKKSLYIAGAVLLAFTIIILLLKIFKSSHKKRKHRKFHGF